MSIRKEKIKESVETQKQGFKNFYDMTPSERSEKETEYGEWIANQSGRTDLLVSNGEDLGVLDSEKALQLIGNIESYLVGVEMTGEYINKVDSLEKRLFTDIFEDVEEDTNEDMLMSAIRESVFKTSKYYASLFSLKAIDKAEKKKAKNKEVTTLDDHLEKEDTSDKEVTSSSSSKKGKKGKKGSK